MPVCVPLLTGSYSSTSVIMCIHSPTAAPPLDSTIHLNRNKALNALLALLEWKELSREDCVQAGISSKVLWFVVVIVCCRRSRCCSRRRCCCSSCCCHRCSSSSSSGRSRRRSRRRLLAQAPPSTHGLCYHVKMRGPTANLAATVCDNNRLTVVAAAEVGPAD